MVRSGEVATSQGSGAEERRHTANDGLLAIAFAETMRPVFARWADAPPRALYQEIMTDLWRGDLASDKGAKHLAELEGLPEFGFDDSHYRDFYVSMALELVHLAIQVVLASAAGAKAGPPWLGLNNLFDELGSALSLDDLLDQFRKAASPIDASDSDGASKMQHLATLTAERVNAALAPTAISLGWTVDRVRGEASRR